MSIPRNIFWKLNENYVIAKNDITILLNREWNNVPANSKMHYCLLINRMLGMTIHAF